MAVSKTGSKTGDEPAPLKVALLGNPNTGKSTLFNALSGGKARIGNFPGVTVEKKTALVKGDGPPILLIDLPGTYSLALHAVRQISGSL